jgi:hypothetical protein
MQTINKFYLKGGSIMLKKLAKVLSVAVVIIAVISSVKTMVDAKKANDAQAYREQIESTVYTDEMTDAEILNVYFNYTEEDAELVSLNGIYTLNDGDVVYDCVTNKNSHIYYSLYNVEYVTNYVNHKIQQEKLAEAEV